MISKQCANTRCGKTFEVTSRHKAQKCCSRPCSEDARRKTPEPVDRDCLRCGKKIERNLMPSGRLESHYLFARRKFCGKECSDQSKVRYHDWELAEELDFLLGTDTPLAIANRLGFQRVESLLDRLRDGGMTELHERMRRLHNEYLDAIREPAERGFWTG